MSRLLSASFLASCLWIAACTASKPAAGQGAPPTTTNGTAERIAVPGGDRGATIGGPGGGTATTGDPANAGGSNVDDPRFHLLPAEGTLTVGNAEGAAGSEAIAAVKLAPAAGYHISTDYPIKLTLEPPDGVTVAKAQLTAGGRDKAQGDADALSEQTLAFSVKATPAKAGSYAIKATFKFGVCDKDSCHPKKQPITIQVAAK